MPGVAAEICDRHSILLIADEVITGYGRTGTQTGSRHWGVKPDFAVTAKAITNGYFPFGAVMIADHVAEVFEADETGRAAVYSGYTYSGHPVGAAAAIACLKETERLKVHENAALRGDELFAGLQALQQKYDIVGDARGGEGLMCALELVADAQAKTPLDAEAIKRVFDTIYAEGVMVRVSGPNLILSPPLVLTAEDVAKVLSATNTGLAAA